MERKSETRSIGGQKYTVRQLGAIEGSKLLAKIAGVAGKALVGGRLNIATLIEGLDDATFMHIVDKLAPYTEVQVSDTAALRLSDVLDAQFAGKYLEMVEWLIFALEVNYRDFWAGLPAMIARLGGPETDAKP